MSRRYDGRTTTFSPEGRLYQVEYASEAIQKAHTAIGVVTKEGIVLATEKHVGNKLLDTENMQDRHTSGDKVFKIAEHLGCAVAGVTSDANILVAAARLHAARHEYASQSPIPVEDICRYLCDTKHGYTQYGGLRPFGVAFLIAGWDKYHGYRLYHTDPSGNYTCWEGFAIGEGDATAQGLLKQHWHDSLSLEEGKLLAVKVLHRTMDSTSIASDRVELAVLTRGPRERHQLLMDDILDPTGVHLAQVPKFRILSSEEMQPVVDKAEAERQKEEEAKARNENNNNDDDE